MRNNLTLERKGKYQFHRVIAALWLICFASFGVSLTLILVQWFDYHLWAACPLDLSEASFILIVPPVVLVMMWKCLSQHFEKGGLRSSGGFMPGNGKSNLLDRAPTCQCRFKESTSDGISWEGFFLRFIHSTAFSSN